MGVGRAGRGSAVVKSKLVVTWTRVVSVERCK